MGNLHSSFGSIRDEEEGGATRQGDHHHHDPILNGNGNDVGLNYYKAAKGLFRFIISILPRRKQNSILPIQNPRATPISKDYDHHALFVQPLVEDIVEGRASSQDKIISIPETVISESEEIVCLSPVIIMHEEEELVEEEEEKKVIKSISVEGIRWIKHYSNCHRILVVGDGDFSFSASLAVAFDRASNMIATSLDSKAFLAKNYGNAHFNITDLRNRGCKVMHGIDATKVAEHSVLGHLKFDRIIYNFPFAGFFKDMPRETQLKRHRRLVRLFLKKAKEMISEEGEIHSSRLSGGTTPNVGLVAMLISTATRARPTNLDSKHDSAINV